MRTIMGIKNENEGNDLDQGGIDRRYESADPTLTAHGLMGDGMMEYQAAGAGQEEDYHAPQDRPDRVGQDVYDPDDAGEAPTIGSRG